MPSSQKGRLKIKKLTMELRREHNVKLVIFRNDRNDTPHLTISWENPTREIDVHLKRRSVGGKEDHRNVAIVKERDFIRLLRSFRNVFLQSLIGNLHKVGRVRPGRLGHWGYAVFYLDEHEKGEMLERIAPLKKHRKWERVFDMQAFVDWAHSPELLNNIYHPSILHHIAAAGSDDVIMAGRIRGKHRPKLMPLGLIKLAGGRSCWINMHGLSTNIMTVSETLTLECLKQILPNDAWTTIFNELHLEEVGFDLE